MAKDPATTRIPRLDGMSSRLPAPGSFGGTMTTSHIRPPAVSAAGNLKTNTQIFRAPTVSKQRARPLSAYQPKTTPLTELGESLKKSASGERLNNAVNMLSKRTTTVLKKYLGQSKLMSASAEASCLPHTPTMLHRKPEQPSQMSSSTPMMPPLMRSETFVCEEEEQHEEQQPAENLSNTRLSNIGFGRTQDIDSSSMTDVTPKTQNSTRNIVGNATQNIECTPNRTRPIVTEQMDLTKSMDQLPLLEHMSIPSGLDLLSAKPDVDADVDFDATLIALAPDKTHMKLPLNSTLNTERLLDITELQSPARHMQLMNLTREFLEQTPSPRFTALARRSAAQHSLVCLTPLTAAPGTRFQQTPVPVHLLSPLLKAARSDLVLPTRTPDAEQLPQLMDSTLIAPCSRRSFGLELNECTLDASIDLVDSSLSASQQQLQALQQQLLKKQHSFDLDESLGILTPDQMKEFLDSSSQLLNHNNQQLRQLQVQQQQQLQLQQQQLRMEQTPSPEELPLDPIEPQLSAALTMPAAQTAVATTAGNSFITSVTSVTSLDTGYQGDGEMSRPASRGACDHSPSNGPQLGRVSRQPSFPPLPAAAPMRRQDPMTDSDFFTESDADDVLQRGDRRAQVIDGQLYGPAMQASASVPQLEDSCMESSGIFTDVENRCDEEMRLPELDIDMEDMSPDDATTTMRKAQQQTQQQQQPRPLSSSSATLTTLSNRTSYCSVDGGSAKSFCDEAFNASSSSSDQQQQQRSSLLSVQRVSSPRTHASLTSLCTVENLCTSSSASNSPKSAKATTTKSATAITTTNPKPLRSVKTPNKWDAVMNKIAVNKTIIKTNYNDVKSKVSSTRLMTGSGSSPTAACSAQVSPRISPRLSPTVRRSPLTATPHKPRSSSSSTASTTSASPAPASASAPMRQPQDKGSVGAGASVFARLTKTTTATTTATASAKRLPAAQNLRGRSYSKDSQKSSHSDLSSLCNGSGSPKLLAKTPLRAAKKRDVRNLSISPTDLGPPPKTQQTAKGQSTRNKSLTPTPTAIQKRISVNPATTVNTASGNNNKSSPKLAQRKQQQQQQIAKNNNTTIKNAALLLAVGIAEESLRSGVDATELQELNSLGQCEAKRRSTEQQQPNEAATNNSIQATEQAESVSQEAKLATTLSPADFEALNARLSLSQAQLELQQRQALGLAIVVQQLTKQMDTLACEENKAQRSLEETIAMLKQTQQSCEKLRQELDEQNAEWQQRQLEQQHQQRSELQQAQDKVQEVQMLAKERLRELELQLLAKDEEKKQALQSYHQEMSLKLTNKQQQLDEAQQQLQQLKQRLQQQEQQEQQLHEKLMRKENSHVLRITAANQREQELQDNMKSLTKELQQLRASADCKERDLRDRLTLTQDEISVLRSSNSQTTTTTQQQSAQQQQRSPNHSLSDSSAELCRLTSEADSLRCVLELKQAEISTLSKQNAELTREAEEQRNLSSRLMLLEAQNELMRTELESKSEREKDTQRQMEEMQKAFNHESIKRKRLTCDKEELQYHLKQRSEQLQLVQAQLHELSNNSSSSGNCTHDSSLNQTLYSRSSSVRSSSQLEHSSPPASPVIKGVIERNDSVSWVLDMDDETPQVAASKLVRRAGSLRSNSERSPTQRRQLTLSASNAHATRGPNPLAQSMSATALLRSQQPDEQPRPLGRARSLSVCHKAAAESAKRQSCPAAELALPEWHVSELSASSPNRSAPAYPKPKKFQEIQESAGEAMVSGANSEDESCSASSEDMRSSSASSTASAAGCTLSKLKKQPSRMSIEEALLLEQANSLNGTPMEVSWSEDAADADAVELHNFA
ncbi:microtubule-associated tumor suppressor candidate 2 homolog [Drosophila busckii]|uniref:microtubule-associated tumor suppressor candidate 2 homolog n=1 Tax=Drosophila busckii TaxID=30019 RepID=UPI00083ECE3A|nr:microtubule-associated tumor suppressor candidate 2 homolog [Drosophila busckii]